MFTPYDGEQEVSRRKAEAMKLASQYLPPELTRKRQGILKRLFRRGRRARPALPQPAPDQKTGFAPT